jgi:hypothetical protein
VSGAPWSAEVKLSDGPWVRELAAGLRRVGARDADAKVRRDMVIVWPGS